MEFAKRFRGLSKYFLLLRSTAAVIHSKKDSLPYILLYSIDHTYMLHQILLFVQRNGREKRKVLDFVYQVEMIMIYNRK